MIKVKVPATSANLGPGFDSMGLALELYNEIEIEETENGIEIIQKGVYQRSFPPERNLVYMAMKRVFDECGKAPKGLKITIDTAIPGTRGLGSSAACIIGGMVGANAIYGMLGASDILSLAAKMESHPDNICPCLTGGLVVSYFNGEKVFYNKMKMPDELSLSVIYPDSTLSTGKSRMALPQRVSLNDASFNASHAALLVSAIASRKYELLKEAMDDRLHQPYRKKVVPYMEEIMELYERVGAYGSYLSGSGPAIAAIIPTGKKDAIKKEIEEYIKDKKFNFSIYSFENNGCHVIKI